MIRDVALGRMSRDTRRARHLEVAAYYEQLADPELAVVVASHYLEALDATPAGTDADAIRAKALDSMAAAADRAADLRAHSQVISISSQALALADNPDLEVPFWERMAEAASKLALRDESVRYGRLVLDHARRSDEPHAVARAVRILATVYADEWLTHEALALLEPHLAEHPDLDEDPELVRAAALLARVLMLVATDEASSVVAAADRAIHAAELSGLTDVLVDALITKATAIGEPGGLVEARILLEGAMDLADRHALGFSAVRSRNNLASLFTALDPPAALQTALEAWDLTVRAGNRAWALFVGSGLSIMYQRMLDCEAIEHLLAEPILADPPGNTVSVLLESRSFLAWVRGDTARAVALLTEAVDLLEGEAESQLAALRANQLVTISRLHGNTEEAFASAMAWGGQGWRLFLGLENALWCVAIIGERERAAELLDVIEQYHGQVLGWPTVLSGIAGTTPGEPLPAADIDETVGQFDANLVALWSIQALFMAARFSPDEHPDRQRWAEEARRRAGESPGILDLIDTYLT
jgi:hypothetical protein